MYKNPKKAVSTNVEKLNALTKEQRSKELEELLDSEMADTQGGCWTCDSYCKNCVSGSR